MVGWEECFKPLFLLPRATKMKGLNVFSWGLWGVGDKEIERDRETETESGNGNFQEKTLESLEASQEEKKLLGNSFLFSLSNHWFA